MKLLRYGPPGQEKPGLLDRDGKIRDLSGAVRDIDGAALAPAELDRLRRLDPATLPLVPGNPRLGPCVGAISKIVAIGLNYRLHAQEAGAAIPTEPIFFMKAPSSICGPNDDVMIPKGSQKTDYEVELGIVIGSVTRYIAVHEAPKHIAGFCVVNDVSEREFQIERLRAMDQGQERRHVLSDRPVAGHVGRGARSRQAGVVDRGQRRAAAEQQYLRPDLRGRSHR